MKLVTALVYTAVGALSVGCYQPPILSEQSLQGVVAIAGPTPETVTLKGHLDHRPFKSSKNFKSFNGIEFFLSNESDQNYNIAPSASVPFEKLVEFDDHFVEIQAVKKTPDAPVVGTAFPIDDFGNPLKRSERYLVMSIRALKP